MTIEAVSCSHSGCVDLRDSRYPDDDVLHLSAEEWAEFLAAVKQGGFDHLPWPGEAVGNLPIPRNSRSGEATGASSTA